MPKFIKLHMFEDQAVVLVQAWQVATVVQLRAHAIVTPVGGPPLEVCESVDEIEKLLRNA